ncbi:hypothetical protein BJP40_06770 [Streptomyces sp. CC53]|uniref:hypothetical protein n=1 Tax=Streptomyces sp. CC53 TaxID=1906740 RepID=UPI0008DDC174|nr:hypothetical protein [Streptomyces sp. CC53]OII61224.1 hypothetical protein BJP40_06770 [Streptomyces sp. CC53]
MAWTAPTTFVDGQVLTAAQLNTYLRDNLMATETAVARTPGSFLVARALSQIVERKPVISRVAAAETTESFQFTDLNTPGPQVTVETGPSAIVFLYCGSNSDTPGIASTMAYEIEGRNRVTTGSVPTGAVEFRTSGGAGFTRHGGAVSMMNDLTPGENTFTAKYKTSGSGTSTFRDRVMIVFPL